MTRPMNDRTPTEATWLLKQGATPEQALERIAQRIAVWRDADPDEDESWESFYEAAFDMLSAEVDDIISAVSKSIAASPPAPAAEPVAYLRAFYGPRGIEVSVSVICPKDFPVVNDRTTEYPLYTHPLDAAAIRAEARREAAELAKAIAQEAYDECEKAVGPCSETGAYECDLERSGRDCLCMHGFDIADALESRLAALADKGEAE